MTFQPPREFEFEQHHLDHRRRPARLANQLFGPLDPLGQTVRIKNIPFTIIGVLTSKGAGMGGQDQDDIVIAPWTTIKFRVSGQGSSVSNQSSVTTSSTGISSLNNLFPPLSTNSQLYYAQNSVQAFDSPTSVRFINVSMISVLTFRLVRTRS